MNKTKTKVSGDLSQLFFGNWDTARGWTENLIKKPTDLELVKLLTDEIGGKFSSCKLLRWI